MNFKSLISIILIFSFSLFAATNPKYPISDHYDGNKFFVPNQEIVKGFFELLKWQLSGNKIPWPDFRNNSVVPTIYRDVKKNELHTTFINHATHLIQLHKFNILTDPVYSERVSPFSFAGPKRVRLPGVAFEELPEVHIVVISHNHYDHMDAETIRRLSEKFNPLFIVPLANAHLVKNMGALRIQELDWWETITLEDQQTQITLTPAQHWSARGVFDRNLALWGSFVIQNPEFKIYLSGDTGYGDHFKKIAEKFNSFDLSILAIGAYEPRWFMKQQHMNPADAVQAHIDINSTRTIGTHFGTFQLTDEGIDDPAAALIAALENRKIDLNIFTVPENGETWSLKK